MSWEELQQSFVNKHIYLNKETENGRVVWLWCECSPLLKNSKLELIRDNLPAGYQCIFFGNDVDRIYITKNK